MIKQKEERFISNLYKKMPETISEKQQEAKDRIYLRQLKGLYFRKKLTKLSQSQTQWLKQIAGRNNDSSAQALIFLSLFHQIDSADATLSDME